MKHGILDLFPKIEVQHKWAFIICVIEMMITHLYMFTNKITNHDDVNRLLIGDTDEMKIRHGRWAGVIFDRVSGSSVSIPSVMGAISILAMVGTVIMLVSLFKIEKKISVILLSGLLCTFPVSANIFLYSYIADVYYISMFLAVWGVWLLVQEGTFAHIVGSILLTLSCGCYQAFWCFGMAFLFLYCFLEFLNEETEWRKFGRKIAERLVYAAVSLGLYLIVNRIVQMVTKYWAVDYEGLDRMGQFDGIIHFVKTLVYTYYEFVQFFYFKGSFTDSWLLIGFNVILTVIVCAIIIERARRKRRSMGYWVMFAVFCCFIPIAANLVSLVSKNLTHILMQYGFVMPYVLCIILAEQCLKEKKNTQWLSYILLGIIVYHGYLIDNELYFRQQLNFEATYSYTIRMLSRIETMEGYDPSVPVAFINENAANYVRIQIMAENYPEQMSHFNYLDDMVGGEPHTFVKKADDIADFCKYYHGYDLKVVDIGELNELAETEIFQQMPVYPQEGSMRYIDGTLVIKLANVE